MSMHFYSTSQKVLFDMEADLFSAIFVICICVDLESVCIFLLTTLCQRFLTARPTAFEFPCGFKYLIPLGCFESPPNSSSLSKSKCHEELWEDWEEEQRSLSCRKSKHLNCFTKNKEKKIYFFVQKSSEFRDLRLFTQLVTASSDLWRQCLFEDHLTGKKTKKGIISCPWKTDSTFFAVLSVQTGTEQIALLNGFLLKSEVSFKPLYSNQLWGRQCSAVQSVFLQSLHWENCFY